MSWSDREMESTHAPADPAAAPGDRGLDEKPTKAIIGIGVLIVLSLLLYEINSFTGDKGSGPQQNVAQQSSPPTPTSPN